MKRMLPYAIAGGFALALGVGAQARETNPLPAPEGFAFADLAGEWHILAHIPYFIENNRVAPTIRFEPRPDGKYDELFTAQKGGFDAERKTFKQVTWAPDPARPWHLKTRLFFVIPARYSVLEFDARNGVLLLGTHKRDKAWIFSRSATMDEAAYRGYLKQFGRFGFEPTRIVRIAQVPSDLGKPGYATVER